MTMAVKVVNLFGDLALESTLKRILKAVTFAKTPTDALRVNIENAQQVLTYTGGSSTAGMGNVTWYSSQAWNTVDPREEMGFIARQNYMATRNRWTIT